MSTLGIMEDRIASELQRSGIGTSIRAAIRSAVDTYQKEPWFFTEDRSVTFSTVASQEFYSVSDNAEIPNYQSIEKLTLTFNTTQRAILHLRDNDWVEERLTITTLVGRPTAFAYFGKQIRLWPIPDAVYSIRITGHKRLATLSSTADGNAWMTDAEQLIRNTAKLDLFENVIRTVGQAEIARVMRRQQEAYDALKAEYASRGATGRVKPSGF